MRSLSRSVECHRQQFFFFSSLFSANRRQTRLFCVKRVIVDVGSPQPVQSPQETAHFQLFYKKGISASPAHEAFPGVICVPRLDSIATFSALLYVYHSRYLLYTYKMLSLLCSPLFKN
jgi:hypothetical protein